MNNQTRTCITDEMFGDIYNGMPFDKVVDMYLFLKPYIDTVRSYGPIRRQRDTINGLVFACPEQEYAYSDKLVNKLVYMEKNDLFKYKHNSAKYVYNECN